MTLIRGMRIDDAIYQLRFIRKNQSQAIADLLEEAKEDAVKIHNVEFGSNLWVGKLYCLLFIVQCLYASRRGASDSVTDSSVLSNPTDAQNVSCLGLCGRDICPKSSALNMGRVLSTFSC